MRVASIPIVVLTTFSLGLALASGYVIVRGPFLGGQALEPIALMIALAAFMSALITVTWGSVRLLDVGARL